MAERVPEPNEAKRQDPSPDERHSVFVTFAADVREFLQQILERVSARVLLGEIDHANPNRDERKDKS